MSDPRLHPDPAIATLNRAARVDVPVCDLMRRPDGPRDRQLLFGAQVTVLHETGDWAYVQAIQDGYVGYVRRAGLAAPHRPTHRVSAPCTHAYAAADLKSRDQIALSHNSLVTSLSQVGDYIETDRGFIPALHLSPVNETAEDPAGVAAGYLGTDYLWGGNSRWGIDCSGLVQAACVACGIPCHGDSDQQQNALGTALASGTPWQRNDVLLWTGHVALVTGPDMMIHATANTMNVLCEPITAAIARIAVTDGPVTAHRRLPKVV